MIKKFFGIDKLEKKIYELENVIQEKEDKIDELEKIIQGKEDKINLLQPTKQELEAYSMKHTLDGLQNEINNAQKKLSSLESTYLSMKSGQKTKLDHLNAEIKNAGIQLNRHKEEIQNLLRQKEDVWAHIKPELVKHFQAIEHNFDIPMGSEFKTLKNELDKIECEKQGILASEDSILLGYFIKLFDLECIRILKSIKSYNVETQIEQIGKIFTKNIELFKCFLRDIQGLQNRNVNLSKEIISTLQRFLELKVKEAKVYGEIAAIEEENKEREREEKKRLAELKREQTKLEKEKIHTLNALKHKQQQIQDMTNDNDKLVLIKEIEELKQQINLLNQKEENIHNESIISSRGWVYVISNEGSHGDNVIKIGVTRRLNPQDRIDEQYNSSVPFRFHTHACIFAEDAFELERNLHHHFNEKRVNKVNRRKEFFNITIDEVESVLREKFGIITNFNNEIDDYEYLESIEKKMMEVS